MSHAVAWELVADHEPRFSSARERYVWRRRRDQLRSDSEPERLLASWLADRAGRELFQSREAPQQLLADPRIVPSGASDPRSRMSAANVAEGYVFAGDLQLFRRAHLLRPGGSDPERHPARRGRPARASRPAAAARSRPRRARRATRAGARARADPRAPRVSVTLPSMTDAQRQGWSAHAGPARPFPEPLAPVNECWPAPVVEGYGTTTHQRNGPGAAVVHERPLWPSHAGREQLVGRTPGELSQGTARTLRRRVAPEAGAGRLGQPLMSGA